MDTANLQVAQTEYSRGEPRAWEIELTLNSPGESEWIIIPEQIRVISVTVSFSGGASGKIQTTTDVVYVIRTGSPIEIDWPFGEVNTNQTKVCLPCSGIRAVQINAGIMKITMRAQ